MSLQTIIAMLVTCMAPLFLVYFVVNAISMLQLDKTTCVSENSESDVPAQSKSFIVLCVACLVACAVLSIYIALIGGRKRAEEEHARRRTVFGDVRQRDEGRMEWFDLNLLKDDVDVDDEEAKRSHFFDVDNGIGDISLKSGSSEDNIEKESLGSASGPGWCVST